MADKLKWGILSTGRIAKTFANGLKTSTTGMLVAVGSRTQAAADAFGKEFGLTRCHGSYEALLADPEVQAVYIAPPHPSHAEWAIKAAEAKKHILCEKPIGMNYPEAMAIVDAALEHDVFLMEAFMYRCHPQTAKLVELIKAKAIGEVRVISATFSFQSGFNPEGRLFKNALGGGGILDVGCYAASMARLVAGAAVGKDFADPIEVKGTARLGSTGVDEWAIASLKFEGGILAQIATGVMLNQENVVRIFGSGGSITVHTPWGLGAEGPTKITLRKQGEKDDQLIIVESDRGLYTREADVVAENIAKRKAPPPAMTPADTLGNMRTLDRWRESIGLTYEGEQAERVRPLRGSTLTRRKGARMKYARLPHLDKDISRLFMGVMGGGQPAFASVMYDDFFERGGNAFDTAYIYGGGRCDAALGQWIKSRGIREQIVILAKGSHTPHCNPEALTRQLNESLERLQTNYTDLYMLHRDNLEVPIGEFVDVLNTHVKAGRIKAFGGSNWTPERIDAGNAYAKSKGLQGFSAVSNNFSLARMVEAPWGGCLASSEPSFRAWHLKTGMANVPWSSQARGFFSGRARPDVQDDKELVRCWYAEDNFKRLARAEELGKKKGVSAINIALAYVLAQPFLSFPIVGPANITETRTLLPALDVELTSADLAWLNLEA